jgi:quercetin dioxygenase-like cupin family protein
MAGSEDASDFRVVPRDSIDLSPADPDTFTGPVTRAEVLPEIRPSGMRGHVFSYVPGSRSNWHVHEGEQALVVVRGEGLVQWEGLPAPRRLSEGDWVHVVPGVPHWHGATPDSDFVHLAITASGGTEWLAAVTEDDYSTPPASPESAP